MDKTGRVDCVCGQQIISNSGKAMILNSDMIACWGCGKIYDYDVIERARKDGEAVIYKSPGINLKVFKMNDCDWWIDYNLEDAKTNFAKFIGVLVDEVIDNPYELSEQELIDHTFRADVNIGISEVTFKQALQWMQSISAEPIFFASTEC